MKMHEAPFSCGFFVTNAFLACTRGLIKDTRTNQPPGKSPLQKVNQLETFLKQEPNVKILWQGSVLGSAVLVFNPRTHFLFDNPDHLICERSVDGLHRSGKFWQLFQPLIFVPEYSTCSIAGMELECQFSSLPQLDTNRFLASFLLVCLCLTTFCNKLLVTQVLRPRIARPLCDGRPFASSQFRRLVSRGLFSYVAPSYCGHYR